MKTSCGLILTDKTKLLALIPWGRKSSLDIPKGLLEEGEDLKACVIREVYEETGLGISNYPLKDLGVFKYQSDKQLHIFMLITKKLPSIKSMRCKSKFKNQWGVLVPEVIGYEYVLFDEPRFFKSLQPILSAVKKTLR